MKFISRVATVFAIAMVMIAITIRQYPYLVLKVPKIGFILYAMVSGIIPPPYMTAECYSPENEKLWARPNDVVLSACVKCGTTFSLYTAALIREHGDVGNFTDLLDLTPWLEFVQTPKLKFKQRLERANFIGFSDKMPFRIIKAHYYPPMIQPKPELKYIIGFREPVDQMASIAPFFISHTKEFSDMWGSFPDVSLNEVEMSRAFAIDKGDGVPLAKDFICDFVNGWWPYRHHKNVLFIHYSDSTKDKKSFISKMAQFMDVKLSDKEIQMVVDKTDIKNMKRIADVFSIPNQLKAFEGEYVPVGLRPLHIGVTIRTGNTGKGQEEVVLENQNALNAYVKSCIKDKEALRYVYEGGPFN